MYAEHQNNLWVATGVGLYRFKDGVATRFSTLDGLSSNFIRAVCEDREGSIWVGTADRGLNRLTRQVVTVYSARGGLVDDNVYPIFEDRARRLWIGSTGLTKFENGVFTRYTKEDGTTDNQQKKQPNKNNNYDDRLHKMLDATAVPPTQRSTALAPAAPLSPDS